MSFTFFVYSTFVVNDILFGDDIFVVNDIFVTNDKFIDYDKFVVSDKFIVNDTLFDGNYTYVEMNSPQYWFILSPVDLVSAIKPREKKKQGGFRVMSSPTRPPLYKWIRMIFFDLPVPIPTADFIIVA